MFGLERGGILRVGTITRVKGGALRAAAMGFVSSMSLENRGSSKT